MPTQDFRGSEYCRNCDEGPKLRGNSRTSFGAACSLPIALRKTECLTNTIHFFFSPSLPVILRSFFFSPRNLLSGRRLQMNETSCTVRSNSCKRSQFMNMTKSEGLDPLACTQWLLISYSSLSAVLGLANLGNSTGVSVWMIHSTEG